MNSPCYWQYETTGTLRPVIKAYLTGDEMTDEQIAAMRAYLRQWIEAPVWKGDVIEDLRQALDGLTSRDAIAAWLATAMDNGIDPL